MGIYLLPSEVTSRVKGTKKGTEFAESFLLRNGLAYHTAHSHFDLTGRLDPSEKSLFIGGEHTTTFHILKGFDQVGKRKNLFVMDAHHDAYDLDDLCYYTQNTFIANELNARVVVMGSRYENEECHPKIELWELNEIQRLSELGEFHLSIDFDVIDPQSFTAVGYPVSNGIPLEIFWFLLKKALLFRPTSIDLVEFNPLCATKKSDYAVYLRTLSICLNYIRSI